MNWILGGNHGIIYKDYLIILINLYSYIRLRIWKGGKIMLEKLSFLETKYKELSQKIIDPEIINNIEEWQRLVKEHADVEPIVMKYREYMKAQNTLEEDREMLQEKLDDEMKEMLKEEVSEYEETVERLEEELKVLLIPKDPNDHKNVIVEIRAGAGGDEAGLFAGDLFRMYSRYAERQGGRLRS